MAKESFQNRLSRKKVYKDNEMDEILDHAINNGLETFDNRV